jgi:hypothetical protein
VQAVNAFYQAANAHNYTLAYALLGPTIKVGNPYERFVTGYQTTLSFQVTATATADPNTVHVDITTVDRVPTGGTVTRQFAGVWHLIPAQNSAGWLLDNAAISQVGGPTSAPANAPQRQIGDLTLTVNAYGNYTGDRLFPAESGTHYVYVDITAKNTGTQTYSLNLFNFHLKDSDGYANTPATTEGPQPKIGAHDMVPGQEVRGFVVFKLGDGRNAVELQYQSFTGTAGVIRLR